MALTRLPLGDEIANHLRRRILGGEFKAGRRLTEKGIAAEMGTSPGPVREAFATLTREGLLISLPHRGTFVSPVSENEARAAYDLRAWIEPYVMETVSRNASSQLIGELRLRVAAMRAADKRKDFSALMGADLEFHARLYEAAGGSVLAKIWKVIATEILKFALIAAPHYYRARELSDTVEDHQRLITLLLSGDDFALRQESLRHLTDLWKRIEASSASRKAQA